MLHQKRQESPKQWQVSRKGTKFLVRAQGNRGIPLLIVLRELLKVVNTRKELKKALHNKKVLVNNKPARDEKIGLTLFDTITLVPSKLSYRVALNGKGKYDVEEIKEKDANNKISKIIDKKVLKNKKVQLNLSDGKNFITDIKCKVGDSVLIDFKNKKIEKCLPLEEKAKVVVFSGKHSGERGAIEKMKPERKMASIKTDEGKTNILIKQLMRIE